ncbi:MAG: hypothetical protein IBX53_06300 [Halomonas sp.]|uniref:hypothetical protein n=1 Tax=Halomonas sp. TaxID=1486246 RepID=UPI001A005509|nr:hypothetical protein [Halomonas sp.]MBE0488672.1 hypothetical protein [Halomonas sp.]
MMSKEFLKKLGIVGITFGLAASPLAFADLHDEEPQEPAPHEEPAPDENYGSAGADDTFESTDLEASEYDTEYEEEEEEWTIDEEEEEEEQEWETPDEDDEESTW